MRLAANRLGYNPGETTFAEAPCCSTNTRAIWPWSSTWSQESVTQVEADSWYQNHRWNHPRAHTWLGTAALPRGMHVPCLSGDSSEGHQSPRAPCGALPLPVLPSRPDGHLSKSLLDGPPASLPPRICIPVTGPVVASHPPGPARGPPSLLTPLENADAPVLKLFSDRVIISTTSPVRRSTCTSQG